MRLTVHFKTLFSHPVTCSFFLQLSGSLEVAMGLEVDYQAFMIVLGAELIIDLMFSFSKCNFFQGWFVQGHRQRSLLCYFWNGLSGYGNERRVEIKAICCWGSFNNEETKIQFWWTINDLYVCAPFRDHEWWRATHIHRESSNRIDFLVGREKENDSHVVFFVVLRGWSSLKPSLVTGTDSSEWFFKSICFCKKNGRRGQ